MKTVNEVIETAKREVEGAIQNQVPDCTPPTWSVMPELLPDLCTFLRNTEGIYMDLLECITGVDNGPQVGTMEVIYHLHSVPYGHSLALKVVLKRPDDPLELASTPSISHIWPAANWHEREAYDLLGIAFEGHPDLRRILLPADWVGWPLRKDYQEQQYYHGITVKY
jgi:NADH-quinone oxidoreductase subunit C